MATSSLKTGIQYFVWTRRYNPLPTHLRKAENCLHLLSSVLIFYKGSSVIGFKIMLQVFKFCT